MQGKRRPIRKQVQTIVLLISVVSLLLTSLIGTFSMLKIKNDSEASLISQVEQHLTSITNNKAGLANAELRHDGYKRWSLVRAYAHMQAKQSWMPHIRGTHPH